MNHIYAIVLAAGKGTRMYSDISKVLHPVCGKPMLQHIVDKLNQCQADEIITVVGHQADLIKQYLGASVQYAFQEQQLGTGHAVMMCRDLLEDKEGTTLIVTGDTPLVKEETLLKLMEHHQEHAAAATVLTMVVDQPTGYGRVIRDSSGLVERIVEHKDAVQAEREVKEINTGIFCFDNQMLFTALNEVYNDNAQGEYYLPDVIKILKEQNERVSACLTNDTEEGLGINDRIQLSRAEQILRRRILERHMKSGVTIIDPQAAYIEPDVIIGKDTVIEPGTHLRGHTVIGQKCIIGPDVDLMDCQVEDEAGIRNSVLIESHVRHGEFVGPYTANGSSEERAAKVKIEV